MGHKLRIAVSVLFGLVTVALCVLWVRSYWWHDEVQVGQKIVLAGWVSNQGQLGFAKHLPYLDWNGSLFLVVRPIDRLKSDGRFGRFYWRPDGGNFWAGVPHWFAVLCMAGVAATPWAYPGLRFSLRALLVVMTLVAVVLGLAVWAGRQVEEQGSSRAGGSDTALGCER